MKRLKELQLGMRGVGGRIEATKEGACQSHCEFSASSVKYEGSVAMT